MDTKQKRQKRLIRHKRVRALIKGTKERPRLSVFRSGRHIYAQLIDDAGGMTLISAGDLEKTKNRKAEAKDPEGVRQGGPYGAGKKDAAFKVGETLAKKAVEKGINSVVFDRGGYQYHGRVKALAEGARKGGLKF